MNENNNYNPDFATDEKKETYNNHNGGEFKHERPTFPPPFERSLYLDKEVDNLTSTENMHQSNPQSAQPQNLRGDSSQPSEEEKRALQNGGMPPHGYGHPPFGGGHPHGKPPKRPNHKKLYVLVVVLAFIASFLGTTIASGLFSSEGNVVVYKTVETSIDYSDATYASVAAAVADSVVEIQTEAVVTGSRFVQYVTEGAGSGVIVSTDGYIITNNHVIDGATTVTVLLTNGESYIAEVIGADSQSDIAVLKIDAEGLTPAIFADSDNAVVGEEVIAVGNPLGELGGSVTNGIISALDREIEVDGVVMNLLQTNAAINPGNSGGGLFNMNGELVGIVNAKNTGEDIDNIGFAIPSNDAYAVMVELIENGYVSGRPALGITALEVSSLETAMQYGLSMTGVYIVESSNSEELLNGDLLLMVGDYEITSTTDITTALTNYEVGETITVVVMRSRKTYEIEITLVESVG